MKKVIEFYDINIHVCIQKSFWDSENDVLDERIIRDKIQQGLEVPIDECDIVINK